MSSPRCIFSLPFPGDKAELLRAAMVGLVLAGIAASAAGQSLIQIPVITTFAGNGSLTDNNSGNGGLATAAGFNNPEGIAYDGKGNTYIADYGNNTIRVVNSSGIVSAAFGTGTACPNPTAASGACGDGGAASAATFNTPAAMQFDTSGNLYIADYADERIRKITAVNGVITGSSIISTVAGNGTGGSTGGGGVATSAELLSPHGLAVDNSGNLFIANQGLNTSCTIEYLPAANQNRIIGGTSTALTAGHLYVIAGQAGTCGYISDSNGTTQATASQLHGPTNVALDSAGNLYIGDYQNGRIRKLTISTGVITTVAGNGGSCAPIAPNGTFTSIPPCGDGAAATSAQLQGPTGIYVDEAGNLIIGDAFGARVRKVTASTGLISTISGTSQQCTNSSQTTVNAAYPTCGDGGAATSALVSFPILVSVNSSGTIFYVDQYDNKVRQISGNAIFANTTIGTASPPSQNVLLQVTGSPMTISSISAPTGPNGVAEFTVNSISGTNCTVNGSTSVPVGTICTVSVKFNPAYVGPRADQLVAVTSGGTFSFGMNGVGVAPLGLLSPGVFATAAGTGTAGSTGDGSSATSATLSAPRGVTFDSAGNYYVADTSNNEIREVNTSGVISVVAGGGATNYLTSPGGLATAAKLSGPTDVAFDTAGNMYIADAGNHLVSRVDAGTKHITVYAGNGTGGYTGDGSPATSAGLNAPAALAVDPPTGNLYIADSASSVVRLVIAASGNITTVAGTGTACATSTATCGDAGLATAAQLNSPGGLARDSNGDLFIGDSGDNRVRRVDGVSGIITTFAGTGNASYTGDGSAATSATLNTPVQVAVDPAGDVYIADSSNNAVRYVSFVSGDIATIAGNGTACSTTPAPACGDGGPANVAALVDDRGIALDAYGNLYVTESGGSRVRKITTNPAGLPFATKPIGIPAPTLGASLYNVGNATLTYTTPVSPNSNALVTSTGPTAAASNAFSQTNATTCGPIYSASATTTLAPGATCNYVVLFDPDTAVGNYTGTLVETDNSLNSGTGNTIYPTTLTQTLNLTGTATQGTATVSVGSSLSPSLVGRSVTLTATVSGLGVPPTGTVTFTYTPFGSSTPVTLGSPVTLSTSAGVTTATLATSLLPLGTDSIVATYNGDTNYAGAPSGALPQVESQQSGAGDTVTAASSSISAGSADQLTFAIPVAAGVSVPTGTVTFTSGATTLASASWPASPSTGTCPPSGPGTCYLLSPTTAPSNIPIGSPTTVTATYAPGATSGYAAPATAPTTTVTVTPIPDTITVTSPSSPDAVLYGSSNVTIAASSTSSQPLTYTSTTSSVCSVTSPGGVVTLLTIGTCTINISQPSAGNYAAATTQTVTINIGAATNTITFPALANTQIGATAPIPAATATSGQPVTYASTTPSVCTVTTGGVITQVSAGTCTLTANQAATGNYAAATQQTQSYQVLQSSQADTLITSNATPTVGASITLTDTVPVIGGAAPATAPTFYYTPSGSSTPVSLGVGTATATPGVYTLATTALPAGADSVTATLPAGGNYAAVTSNFVTETVAQSTVPGVLTTSNATPTVGTSVMLTDTIAVINGAAPPVAPTFYYTMSGSSTPISLGLGAATATPGVFKLATTALPVGTDSVTANLPAGGNYAASISNIVTETVAQSTVPGVLTTSNASPTVGTSVTLTDTVAVVGGAAPPVAPTFYYTPSGSSTPLSLGLGIATATPGVYTLATTALPAGTDSVTANLPAGGNYAAVVSNIVTETVAQSTAPGVLTTSNANPAVGASVTLTDTVAVVGGAAPSVAPTFYYTPSGSSTPVSLGLGIATATPGVYTLATTALPVGTDSVTANLPAGGNYAAVTSNIITETVAQSTVPGVLTTSNATPTAATSVTLTDTVAVVGGAAPPVAPTFYYTPSGSSTPVPLGVGIATATPGVYTLATTALPVGADSVTANLPAGGNYAASISNIVTETVAQSTTPGVLTTSNATPTVGASVTLTDTIAVINGAAPPVAPTFYYTPSGSSTPVSLGIGIAAATPGVYTLATTALPAGTDSVTANLPAGGNYAAVASNIVAETVAQSMAPGLLTTSNATPTVGASVTLTDTIAVVGGVAPPVAPTFYYTPSGSSTPVSLGIGVATATPGVFTLATSALPVGTDAVTANLPVGGNYAASVSNIVTETVAQSTTPGVLTTSNAAPTAGTSITLTDTIAVINGVAPPVAPTFYYTPSGASTPVSLGLGTATATPGVFTLATTALPVGTDSVTANLPAGGNYAAETSNMVLEAVTGATDTITFPALPNTAFGTTPPIPAATSTSGQPVTYSTTSTACSITTAGVITFNSIGSCAITASQAAAGTYSAATPVTQTFTISVEADTITVTSPSSPDAVAYGSGTVAIAANSTSGQPISYATTTPTVCSVSLAGVVTVLSSGTCTITLNQSTAGNYAAAAQQTVTLNVSAGANTITFPALANTPFGATPPVPSATSTAGGAIAYASTTPTVCTATSAGVIADLAIGTCTITADQAATGNYAAAAQQSRSYQITVAPDTITILPGVPTTTPYSSGGTFPIAATSTSGVTPTYTSTTPTICSVSSTGVVTSLSTGVCTINVSQPAAGNYAAATTVPVTVTVTAGINTITFPSLPNTLLNATPPVPVATATSGQPVTYFTASTACSVTPSGVITFLTNGTCAITASQSATGNYAAAAPATQSFSVNLSPAVITGTVPASAEPGSGTISIGAVSTSNQPITYLSTTPSVCTVTSPGGVVTVLATGTCSITASQPAGGGFAAGSAIFVISVNDFTIAAQAPLTQSVIPGSVATFTYALAPVGIQYPGATVTYTVTGCPPGATCAVNPATVAQGAGPQTLTLTVSTAQAVALHRVGQTAPWSFALLLPFLALRKPRRKLAKAITICVLLLAAITAVTGCATSYGFFGQPAQTYSITVSATSGGITHTAVAVNLQVQ